MYIQHKPDEQPREARIGRVQFSKSGKSLHYNGKTFQSLNGAGFKTNYFDTESGEQYWISGCKKMEATGCTEKGCPFILTRMLGLNTGQKYVVYQVWRI